MTVELTFKHPDDYAIGEIIIPVQTIDRRIAELARTIAKKYNFSEQLLVVGLLTGAAWLTVDLFAQLHIEGLTDAELTFMRVSSYSSGTTATHEPRIDYDSPVNPEGKRVFLVDDITDTGKSLKIVEQLYRNRGAQSVESLVLLDKPSRREVSFTPDYAGFQIPNIWVQGRGMDSIIDGHAYGRGDPNIRKGPYAYTRRNVVS